MYSRLRLAGPAPLARQPPSLMKMAALAAWTFGRPGTSCLCSVAAARIGQSGVSETPTRRPQRFYSYRYSLHTGIYASAGKFVAEFKYRVMSTEYGVAAETPYSVLITRYSV